MWLAEKNANCLKHSGEIIWNWLVTDSPAGRRSACSLLFSTPFHRTAWTSFRSSRQSRLPTHRAQQAFRQALQSRHRLQMLLKHLRGTCNHHPSYKQSVYTTSVITYKGHIHTHIRLTALCPGLPGWAGTWKVKPFSILLKQKTCE